jgi:hypothetical protein
VAEWFKAAVLKTVEAGRLPGVRIPSSPPTLYSTRAKVARRSIRLTPRLRATSSGDGSRNVASIRQTPSVFHTPQYARHQIH